VLTRRRLAWLHRVTRETSHRGIARRLGVSHTTVARWIRDGLTLPHILDVCVALDIDPYDALEELGISEVPGHPRGVGLRLVSTIRLVEELQRRAELRAADPTVRYY
jgi:hypothetical protein